MGWSRGSELFGRIAELIEAMVPKEQDRAEIYQEMIAAFEEFDCDTLFECEGIDPILDELLDELYSTDKEEDQDDEWPDGGREDFS